MKTSRAVTVIGLVLVLAYVSQTIILLSRGTENASLVYLNLVYAASYAVSIVLINSILKVGVIMGVMAGTINAVRLLPASFAVERGLPFIASHAALIVLACTFVALSSLLPLSSSE
ncbi:MAG: hypothetical protein NZ920_01490 [Aigarchaeota archaeon]|nr:hypothetical protein [Aigarchaeota archaeon]MDW8093115.1 hypothetical protein [Nitrososphaerota archaeon]